MIFTTLLWLSLMVFPLPFFQPLGFLHEVAELPIDALAEGLEAIQVALDRHIL